MAKILGLADIEVDGVTILTGADATLDTGGVSRDARIGNKVAGFSEAVAQSKIEVSVFVDGNYSIDRARNTTNATINFKADTGQVWMINGAWCSAPPSIDQKAGTAKETYEGPPAEEIL